MQAEEAAHGSDAYGEKLHHQVGNQIIQDSHVSLMQEQIAAFYWQTVIKIHLPG